MTTITIRDVKAATHAELVARAARKGQSLQEYLKALLEESVVKPDMETLMAQIRERKAKYPTNLTTERIIELLDETRR
ncbi:MAG: hypothetical protein AB7P33_09945 [Dehalococcoidia bacterium]